MFQDKQYPKNEKSQFQKDLPVLASDLAINSQLCLGEAEASELPAMVC